MDEPRSIPIRQSLLRPELVMGGEREPVMLTALFSFIVGIVGAVSAAWITVVIAISFYIFAVQSFRRMAKDDPIMTKVWTRHINYRHYYSAQSGYWSQQCYKRK